MFRTFGTISSIFSIIPSLSLLIDYLPYPILFPLGVSAGIGTLFVMLVKDNYPYTLAV